MSELSIFKNRITNKNYGPSLTNVIYQYCTCEKCKPTSFDKLEVVAYCIPTKSNHGMLRPQYGKIEDDVDEHNIIIVYNPEKKWYSYLVFPPKNFNNDPYFYAFDSGDYCYCYTDDGFADDETLIYNRSGDQLCVKAYDFVDGSSIPGSKIFPENYIDFSKFCLKYLNKTSKPSLNEMVKKFNEQY